MRNIYWKRNYSFILVLLRNWACGLLTLAIIDFKQKFKEALKRISNNLAENNIRGCFNNSVDITRASEFVGFNEGVFIGEVLEGIFDNFGDVFYLFEYENEEIEPVKSELNKLIKIIDETVPSKNNAAKAELYDALVTARCCVTQIQVLFARERKTKKGINPMFELAE